MTLSKLAAETKMSRTTLMSIEGGEQGSLNASTAYKLDQALDWEPGCAAEGFRTEDPEWRPTRTKRLIRKLPAATVEERRSIPLAEIEESIREDAIRELGEARVKLDIVLDHLQYPDSFELLTAIAERFLHAERLDNARVVLMDVFED